VRGRTSEIRDVEGSIAPELLAAQEEEKQLSNVPQDYILSTGFRAGRERRGRARSRRKSQ
jgi:hypothetical protein